jgi:hypothetical protein
MSTKNSNDTTRNLPASSAVPQTAAPPSAPFISLYSVNWYVLITEKECVYCAVRAGYLNIVLVILIL